MKHISEFLPSEPEKINSLNYIGIIVKHLEDYISLMHSEFDGTSIMVDEIEQVEKTIAYIKAFDPLGD